MGIAGTLYNNLFRRNYAMVGAVFASAFVFEIGFDVYSQRFWDWKNQGRQWKDIRHKYVTEDDE